MRVGLIDLAIGAIATVAPGVGSANGGCIAEEILSAHGISSRESIPQFYRMRPNSSHFIFHVPAQRRKSAILMTHEIQFIPSGHERSMQKLRFPLDGLRRLDKGCDGFLGESRKRA